MQNDKYFQALLWLLIQNDLLAEDGTKCRHDPDEKVQLLIMRVANDIMQLTEEEVMEQISFQRQEILD